METTVYFAITSQDSVRSKFVELFFFIYCLLEGRWYIDISTECCKREACSDRILTERNFDQQIVSTEPTSITKALHGIVVIGKSVDFSSQSYFDNSKIRLEKTST